MIYYIFDIWCERRNMENILKRLRIKVIKFLSFRQLEKDIIQKIRYLLIYTFLQVPNLTPIESA